MLRFLKRRDQQSSYITGNSLYKEYVNYKDRENAVFIEYKKDKAYPSNQTRYTPANSTRFTVSVISVHQDVHFHRGLGKGIKLES